MGVGGMESLSHSCFAFTKEWKCAKFNIEIIFMSELMEIWPFPAFPGDPILRQESQLCLTATSVVFLTECFESVSGKEETGIGCLLNQLFVLTNTNILKFLMSDNITTNNFKNI